MAQRLASKAENGLEGGNDPFISEAERTKVMDFSLSDEDRQVSRLLRWRWSRKISNLLKALFGLHFWSYFRRDTSIRIYSLNHLVLPQLELKLLVSTRLIRFLLLETQNDHCHDLAARFLPLVYPYSILPLRLTPQSTRLLYLRHLVLLDDLEIVDIRNILRNRLLGMILRFMIYQTPRMMMGSKRSGGGKRNGSLLVLLFS